MAIAFTNYVDITSGVGAGTVVNRRDFIGRLFSTNPLIPTKTLIEFTTLEDVGTYFGTDSEEYARASFYFGWVSKNITSPDKIGYYRWTDAAVAPRIYGARFTTTLSAFTAISTGAISLTLGATTHVITGIDLTGAGSLAAVAAILQVEIRAADVAAQWASATVTYDATRGAFNFVGGATGAAAISVALAGSGVELRDLIGWGSSAILSNGAGVETITTVLTESANASNNFGSFLFLPTLTLDQIVEAAEWNNAQNVLYQYMVPVSAANSVSYSAALFDLAGVAVTLSPLSDEYPEQVPMMILAATDYGRPNSVQNYMFQIFNLTPSVTDTTTALAYDVLRINYYGQTQTAGQFLNFYQRGLLMGTASSPRDMNTYANEQWLKDEAGAAIMQLLLALAEVSANQKGRGQLLVTLQTVVGLALINGTISVGKPLTSTQKLYITEISNDPKAYFQVGSIGYWLNTEINPITNEAGYTLVYSKDDTIRKVSGSHVLI